MDRRLPFYKVGIHERQVQARRPISDATSMTKRKQSKGNSGERFKMVGRTVRGLEEILAQELRALGAARVTPANRAVTFEGDRTLLYRANYELRTALRILKPIYSFRIAGQSDLYRKLKQYDWARHLSNETTFAIDSAVHSRIFSNSLYAALKTKDAIVDWFREKTGRRPSVDTERPDLRLHLHLADRECTISLDSSGESLHRRGYRTEASAAPLSEVLAAGLVLAAGWDGETPFLDPMCGSGTIAIEAALIAGRIPPGRLRERFGFMGWPEFDEDLWQTVRANAQARSRPISDGLITAYDIDRRAIAISRANMGRAGLSETAIHWQATDFLQEQPPAESRTIVMNPPFGERLQSANLNDFYKSIGDQLKQRYSGSTAWILSSNLEALKKVGLKPSRKLTVQNGPLECSFRRYDMYTGSMDQKPPIIE